MYSYDGKSLLDSMTIIGYTLPETIDFNINDGDYKTYLSLIQGKLLDGGSSTQYYGVMVEAVGFY